MSSHMPVCVFSGMWPVREESYEAVLDSNRCRCPAAVAGMTNSSRALLADVNLGSRSRRNSEQIPQIQRATVTPSCILLYWMDQVCKTGVSCQDSSSEFQNGVALFASPVTTGIVEWHICGSPLCPHCWLLEQTHLALTFLPAPVNVLLWTFQRTSSLETK